MNLQPLPGDRRPRQRHTRAISTCTIRNFAGIKVENTRKTAAYRDLLFSAKGLSQTISGVILYTRPSSEIVTARRSWNGWQNGILPGIRSIPAPRISRCAGEKVTEGLDSRQACAEYAKMGKFAKWRAVITIGQDMPSSTCIAANAHARPLCGDLPGRGPGARVEPGADGRRPPSSAAKSPVDVQCRIRSTI